MSFDVPDKLYFKIGEVAEIVGVETHVLRYWESEFPQVRPNRAVSKQRLYRRRDVDLFLEIKRLLYEEEYTISGAKKKLREPDGDSRTEHIGQERELLRQVRDGLKAIRTLLKDR